MLRAIGVFRFIRLIDVTDAIKQRILIYFIK